MTATTTNLFFPLAFAVITLSLPALQASENILKNPGFEADANADGKPDYWFVYPDIRAAAVEPEVSLMRDDGAPAGSAYIRLGKKGGKPLALTQIVSDAALNEVLAGEGREFVVRAKGRAADLSGEGAALVVQVFYRDQGGARKFAGRFRSESLEGSTDWVQLEVPVNLLDIIPSGLQYSDVEINLELSSDSGSADFDDLALTAE